MRRKTDFAGCYNDNDFMERGGDMEEITVTITLCEYRNMVREQARNELQIERLQDEKAKLELKCKDLETALAACKLPEWMKDIGRALSGEDRADEETEDAAEAEETENDTKGGGAECQP